MFHTFTTDELREIHLALIMRERYIRETLIPSAVRNNVDTTTLTVEADMVSTLTMKACAAKVSEELGFYVEPVAPRRGG